MYRPVAMMIQKRVARCAGHWPDTFQTLHSIGFREVWFPEFYGLADDVRGRLAQAASGAGLRPIVSLPYPEPDTPGFVDADGHTTDPAGSRHGLRAPNFLAPETMSLVTRQSAEAARHGAGVFFAITCDADIYPACACPHCHAENGRDEGRATHYWCHDDRFRAAWRDYLADRFRTVERLNAIYGTDYTDWPAPPRSPFLDPHGLCYPWYCDVLDDFRARVVSVLVGHGHRRIDLLAAHGHNRVWTHYARAREGEAERQDVLCARFPDVEFWHWFLSVYCIGHGAPDETLHAATYAARHGHRTVAGAENCWGLVNGFATRAVRDGHGGTACGLWYNPLATDDDELKTRGLWDDDGRPNQRIAGRLRDALGEAIRLADIRGRG